MKNYCNIKISDHVSIIFVFTIPWGKQQPYFQLFMNSMKILKAMSSYVEAALKHTGKEVAGIVK